MKKFRTLTIILIVLFFVATGTYLFIQYDNRHFLTYGVLHIGEKPSTLKILEFESFGLTDSQLEYYVSINKSEFSRLLKGRNYTLRDDPQGYFTSWATGQERYKFKAEFCYTSGEVSKGLVNIFVNEDKSEAYIVYDVN